MFANNISYKFMAPTFLYGCSSLSLILLLKQVFFPIDFHERNFYGNFKLTGVKVAYLHVLNDLPLYS